MNVYRTTGKRFDQDAAMRRYYGTDQIRESLNPEFIRRREYDIGLIEAMRKGAEQIKE